MFSQIFSGGSLEITTKDSFIYKKSQKNIISDAKILKPKTKECGRNNLCFSYHFRTFLPSSAKNFMGASAQALLKVATKVFLKNCKSPSKINMCETNDLNKQPTTGAAWLKQVFLIIFERWYLFFFMFSRSECTSFTKSSHHLSP